MLTQYLTYLFSLSTEIGRVPCSAWKVAVVAPIHKGGVSTDINNYRPISITSCCSRIIERIISRKIWNFLHSKCIIDRVLNMASLMGGLLILYCLPSTTLLLNL